MENNIKTLILLMTCLALSLFQIENFITEKRNLFIDRVSSQNYYYKHDYLHFSEDGRQIRMHDDRAESLQILTLDSIYSSSKAVYRTQAGKYIGIVLLDSSVYMTKSTNSIMTIDFNIIYFLGVQEKLLL